MIAHIEGHGITGGIIGGRAGKQYIVWYIIIYDVCCVQG